MTVHNLSFARVGSFDEKVKKKKFKVIMFLKTTHSLESI